MVAARNITMLEQMARAALTNITVPPVPGQAYRNTALGAGEMANGDRYDSVFDSAKYNQVMWAITGLMQQVEQFGILPYSALTNYQQGGLCLGLNGMVYQAVLPSGPGTGAGPQPTSNTMYWEDWIRAYYQNNLAPDFWILKRLETYTAFYVNGMTGNDDISVNNGLSPATAWKTILGGCNNIANNYFLAASAQLNVAAGTYNEDLYLPKYFSSQGSIAIVGDGLSNTFINGSVDLPVGVGRYELDGFSISFAGRSSPGTANFNYYCARTTSGTLLYLTNCKLFCGGANSGLVTSRYAISATGGEFSIGPNVTLLGEGAGCKSLLNSTRSCSAILLGDLVTLGTVELANFFVDSVGSISFDLSLLGRAPTVTGDVTGRRTGAETNGIIYTAGTGGDSAVPGTIDGYTDSGGRVV